MMGYQDGSVGRSVCRARQRILCLEFQHVGVEAVRSEVQGNSLGQLRPCLHKTNKQVQRFLFDLFPDHIPADGRTSKTSDLWVSGLIGFLPSTLWSCYSVNLAWISSRLITQCSGVFMEGKSGSGNLRLSVSILLKYLHSPVSPSEQFILRSLLSS